VVTKVLRTLDRALGVLAGTGVVITMAGMAVVIALQVYFRYVAGSPLAWSEEAARYLMVWLVFLGAPAALRTGEHVGVTVIRDLVPRLPRLVVTVVGELIVLALLLYVFYHGFQVSLRNLEQTSPTLRIPMGWVTAAIPLGSGLMLVEVVKSLVANVRALLDPARPVPVAEATTPALDGEGGASSATLTS
jgi:TRAP-type C4-dicarboxylate transport system permease small subunit